MKSTINRLESIPNIFKQELKEEIVEEEKKEELKDDNNSDKSELVLKIEKKIDNPETI